MTEVHTGTDADNALKAKHRAMWALAEDLDAVLSVGGIMFAPHHEVSANEMLRVCRPGGTLGLINWTPNTPGATPPPRWGDEDHVQSLLGDRVTDFTATRRNLSVTAFDSPEDFRDYFKERYGPTIATYRNIADDPERVAALDRDLVDLRRRFDRGSGDLEWEYPLVTARQAT